MRSVEAVSTQDGGTRGNWLAGGGGHRRAAFTMGHKSGHRRSLPRAALETPVWLCRQMEWFWSGSPGDRVSSSFSAIPLGKSPSLMVNAPPTHPKCSLSGSPGEGGTL